MGVFPDIWKTTNATPIPKVNNTINYAKFRPMNMALDIGKNCRTCCEIVIGVLSRN